jgi:ankyrin repeat protein
MNTTLLPARPNPEQFKKQAKDLVKDCRSGNSEAIQRVKKFHPRYRRMSESDILKAKFTLTDIQFVIARENGFPSWTKFKEYLLFHNAVRALDAGDLGRLEGLLRKHPFLIRYHCRTGKWYEEGYFAGATLLNHIAGNPSRCPLPSNILDITRLLLSLGARDDPKRPKYTIGLLLTSKQASEAGVALPLIDLLTEVNEIELDLTAPDILSGPLGNQAPATAEALIRRGARMDIRHAAALGRLDLVKRFVNEGDRVKEEASLILLPEDSREAKALLEQAFIDACMLGQTGVAEFLLEKGVDTAAGANVGQTALHYAAHGGHLATVEMLLARKAPLEVKNMYGGTVLGQAIWSACNEPMADHLAIIEALIAASAKIEPDWNRWIDELRRRYRATESLFPSSGNKDSVRDG